MKNLKLIRQKLNITQIRLSVAAEVSQETISAYEAGKALPSVYTLIKMANFLNTSTDYLLDLTDNPLPYSKSQDKNTEELLVFYNKLDQKGKNDVLTYTKIREKLDE
ncbi:MAG: helix-turn-helix transcriptional regulator [Bacilli bacterium]|nr:helix-turn-helix transcriptional regulator [Bacilli bacterium]